MKKIVWAFVILLGGWRVSAQESQQDIKTCYRGEAHISIELPNNETAYFFRWETAPLKDDIQEMDWIIVKDWGTEAFLDLTNLTQSVSVRYSKQEANVEEPAIETNEIATITVYEPLQAGVIGSDQTICYNTVPQALNMTINASGGDGSYSYQWQQNHNNVWQDITDAIGSSYQPSNLTQSSTYRLQFKDGSQCGTTYSQPVTITVYEPIQAGVIGSDQTICYNTAPNEFRFTTQPSGEGGQYTYQWQQSSDNTTFNDIANTTTNNFQAPNLTENASYRVKITSIECATEAISNPITITVRPEFKPGTIGNEQTICYNTAPQTLTGTDAQGGNTPYGYQWQQSNNGTDFVNANGTGSNTLNFKPNSLKETTWFRLQYTSAEQCGTLYSNIIQITVRPEFKPGTIGNNQTICYNTTPTALNMMTNATGGDGSYSYQWQQNHNNVWQDITDAIGSSYQPSNLTQSSTYRLQFKDGSQCGTTYSQPVTITVYEQIKAGAIGNEQTICYNTAPSEFRFTTPPSGEDGQYTYQWQQSYDGITFNDIPNTDKSTFLARNLTENSYFRAKITSNKCATEAISNPITITVRPEFKPGTIGDNQTICYNTSPQTLTATDAQGGSTPYSYQWQQSNNGTDFANAIGTGNNTLNFKPNSLKETTWFRLQYTSAEQCGTLYSNIIQITVRPEFKPGTIGNNQTICYNTTPTALNMMTNATGGDGSYSYQWQQRNNNTWQDVADAIGISYQPSNLTQSSTYRLQFKDGSQCGTTYSQPVTITVYEPIQAGIIGSAQTICYNTAPNEFRFTTPPSGEGGQYTYQWQQSTDGSDFIDIDGTGAAFKASNLIENVSFRVKITSVQCSTEAISNAIAITVRPEFKAGTITIGNQKSDTICYDSIPLELELLDPCTGGEGHYTYQWQQSYNRSSFENINLANQIVFAPDNLSRTTYYRLLFKDLCGTLYSDTIKIFVWDAMTPTSIAADQTICYNTIPDPLHIHTQATGADGSFSNQWQQYINSEWQNIANETSNDLQPERLDRTRPYRVASTSHYGCGTVYSQPVTVTVYEQIRAGVIGSEQTICYNTAPNEFRFTTPPSGEGGQYTYQWQQSTDGDFVDIENGTSPSFKASNLIESARYRSIVSSPKCQTSDTSNIISVSVLPEFIAGTIGSADTICQFSRPDTLKTLIPCSGADGRYSYSWLSAIDTLHFTSMDGASKPDYQPQALEQTTYFRLIFTSDFGCGDLASNIIEINVVPLPADRTIVGNMNVCANQHDVEYYFTETDDDTKYVWRIDGGDISEYIDSTHIIVYWDSISDVGSLTLTQIYTPLGCISTTDYIIKKSYFAPNKTAILRKQNTDILMCAEHSPGIEYEWGYRNIATGQMNMIPESNFQYMQIPQPINTYTHDYFVITRFRYNTKTCSTISYYDPALAQENIEKHTPYFSIYPNPTKSAFSICANNDISTEVTITITSATGTEIFNKYYHTFDNSIELNLSLKSGLYIISVITRNGKSTQKLIVQ